MMTTTVGSRIPRQPTQIARAFGISRSSAYRYLVAMAEKKLIGYADGIIRTALMGKCSTDLNSTPILGSVICGDPTQEQECIEEYVSLPESIFGNGDCFFLLSVFENAYTHSSHRVSYIWWEAFCFPFVLLKRQALDSLSFGRYNSVKC